MIGMMGALSWVTSFMVWALATQGWMMYMATGLSSIGIDYDDDEADDKDNFNDIGSYPI